MIKNKHVNERLKITFIGCGQCGCQIVSELEKTIMSMEGNKTNLSFCGINTSVEDLASVELSHKIHIKNSNGAACDRDKSTMDLAETIEEVLEELEKHIIPDSIIYLAFSLGGGTGSAVAPELTKLLLEMGYTVGMIPVLPADTESLKIKDNARLSFNEVEELKPRMASIFLLDNNAGDKLVINRKFSSLMSSVLCINNQSMDGNMDLAEIEACLKCPSFSVIIKTGFKNGTTGGIIDIFKKGTNIFPKREDKTINIMGISEATSAKDSKIDIVELRKEIGIAPTEFHGYLSESGENVIILSGLMMPYSRINGMMEYIQKNADMVQNSVKALTEVRTTKTMDVFAHKAEPSVIKSVEKTGQMSALEKLKAKRISK